MEIDDSCGSRKSLLQETEWICNLFQIGLSIELNKEPTNDSLSKDIRNRAFEDATNNIRSTSIQCLCSKTSCRTLKIKNKLKRNYCQRSLQNRTHVATLIKINTRSPIVSDLFIFSFKRHYWYSLARQNNTFAFDIIIIVW